MLLIIIKGHGVNAIINNSLNTLHHIALSVSHFNKMLTLDNIIAWSLWTGESTNTKTLSGVFKMFIHIIMMIIGLASGWHGPAERGHDDGRWWLLLDHTHPPKRPLVGPGRPGAKLVYT